MWLAGTLVQRSWFVDYTFRNVLNIRLSVLFLKLQHSQMQFQCVKMKGQLHKLCTYATPTSEISLTCIRSKLVIQSNFICNICTFIYPSLPFKKKFN
uniref:Uncharacterized protein n=1 Tax=Anguilla anguilla TaxID=7936 RepID=A0A0E9XJP3_ANGAN